MQLTLDYRPTPKQAAFHRSAAFEVLYGGAAGGGKTKAIAMEALVDALEHPGVHSYLFRRTYPELRDTLLREVMESLPPGMGNLRQTTHDLELPNGSVLHFRHCRSMADCYRYQGAEINRLYIDELTHFTEGEYNYLKTRLRAKASLGVSPRVRCTANPGGVGHAWVRARFIDPMPPGEVRAFGGKDGRGQAGQTRQYIPATVADNPHLAAGYREELEQKPPALRRALLLGDWNAFEGQVFEEFRDDAAGYRSRRFSHVIDPFDLPAGWPIYRGFDWGYTRPFSVGYWAKSPDGVLYRFFEIYGCRPGEADRGLRMDPRTVARQVAAFERENLAGRRMVGVADPSIFDESRGEDGCVAALFAREGLYFEKGDNRRLPGKMQLHARLRFDEQGLAGLYVFSCCRAFIRTLPALCYDPLRPEDVDSDQEDHVYDEARYVCMANPLYTPPPPAAPHPPGGGPLEIDPAPLRGNSPYDAMMIGGTPVWPG
ncbi:phage terminase large subunit [Acetanaerobacterium sp. MSJ-12]|uniref:phage terminase large subunit n=1 Tax=Acetanaerobacterium sp. MSJ-12 TaxID=2841535 RepID=UPI001C0EE88F|nr:phage terminase large subunit [Acetanaerobacterium sp. MSJ-12]MBU5419772.1 phage terminase large subunit [Acetanaerobacterium sp. MSJ-12]